MGFVWFRPEGPLRSREQVAREVHAVAVSRGLDELATVIALMTISTEVGTGSGDDRKWWCPWNSRVIATKNYPYDSQSDDNRSSGYFQQQPGPNGEPWWGSPENMMTLPQAANTFFERLADEYGRSKDNPRLAGEFAQRVQGSAFPDRYAGKWDEAWTVLRRALNDQPQENPVAPKGDPVWLEEALRKRLGDRLVVHEGWKERGTGGVMGEIWGVMIHHTGNVNERVETIRDGVQQPSGWLPGPLSQALITPDGKFHLIAVGPCNHAGGGKYGSLTQGNRDSIGFECAYSGSGRWPDAQILTMRDATRAVLEYCGHDSSRVCGHKEYALPAGRKVDPGNMDMDWFRGEVQKALDGKFDKPATTTPPPAATPDYLKEIWDQLRIEWPQLDNKTLVDAVAEMKREIKQISAALAALGDLK